MCLPIFAAINMDFNQFIITLLKKFTIAKLSHDLTSKELAFFEDYIQPTNRKLVTTYDLMLKFI